MASCKPSVIPQPKSALPTPKVPGVTTKAIEPKAPNVTVKQAIELAKAPRAGTTEAKEVEAGNALVPGPRGRVCVGALCCVCGCHGGGDVLELCEDDLGPGIASIFSGKGLRCRLMQ